MPSHQEPKILGVVFDSSVFPEQNGAAVKTRLTVSTCDYDTLTEQ